MNKKSYWIIRIGLAVVFIWFGIDKLIAPINWFGYVPSFIDALPISIRDFVLINGLFEIILGLMLLWPRSVRIAADIIAAFLVAVLVFQGFNEVTIRDLGLIAMALSLIVWKKY